MVKLTCGSNGNITQGSKYQEWTSWLANKLRAVHPNFITFVGLVSGLASAYFLWKRKSKLIAIALYGTYIVCDTLDGCIARGLNKKSSFGALFDKGTDITVNIATLLAAYYRCPYKRNDVLMIYFLWKLVLMFKPNYKSSLFPLVVDMEKWKMGLYLVFLYFCEFDFRFLPTNLFGHR